MHDTVGGCATASGLLRMRLNYNVVDAIIKGFSHRQCIYACSEHIYREIASRQAIH